MPMDQSDQAPVVQLLRIRPAEDKDIPLPAYMTAHSAGMDLQAAIPADITLERSDIVLVPTGFAMAIPPGYEAQIRPRSGLAVKQGVTVINTPGTIDADYRGEIQVALVNLGKAAYTVKRGDRIAQMVFQQVSRARPELVETLTATDRGAGGFGHTGV